MTFLDNAITSHSTWKIRLLTAVNGGEVPDKSTCCVDNTCDLGKWIYSEGQKTYGQSPEFSSLKTTHKKFHQTVGAVIDLVQKKNIPEAKKNILEGEFYSCSHDVVKSIMNLKKLVH